MGWWSLGMNGGIAGIMDANHPNQRCKMYMGDGPADILDNFVDVASNNGWDVDKTAIKAYLIRDNIWGIPEKLHNEIQATRHALIREWREAWERDPMPEELEGVVDFCIPYVIQRVTR